MLSGFSGVTGDSEGWVPLLSFAPNGWYASPSVPWAILKNLSVRRFKELEVLPLLPKHN